MRGARIALPNKDKELLYLGRIDYNQKRVRRVIDIWNKLEKKYPDWLFLKINFSTADAVGFAVFTNELEKEFLVEVAHLGDDGKLHRVYILNY